MNRRRKKQQKTDYVALSKKKYIEIKNKCAQFEWQSCKQIFNVKKWQWPRWNKQAIQARWFDFPKLHRRALMILVPVVFILLILPTPELKATSKPNNQRVELDINLPENNERPQEQHRPFSQPRATSTPKPVSSASTGVWKEYTVKQGDTLAQVFRNINLPMSELNQLVKVEGNGKPLSQIAVGQKIRFKINTAQRLEQLQLAKGSETITFARLSDGHFERR